MNVSLIQDLSSGIYIINSYEKTCYFFFPWTFFFLWTCKAGVGTCPCCIQELMEQQGTLLQKSPFRHPTLTELLGARYLAHCYLSSAPKVYWHCYSTPSNLSRKKSNPMLAARNIVPPLFRGHLWWVGLADIYSRYSSKTTGETLQPPSLCLLRYPLHFLGPAPHFFELPKTLVDWQRIIYRNTLN